jgi:hypothetical protein
MNNLIWKLKQLFRQALPLVLIGGLLYGAYNLYRKGVLQRGVKPTINYVVRQIPILGSHFKPFGRSYSYSKRHHRRHGKHRRSRRHRRH